NRIAEIKHPAESCVSHLDVSWSGHTAAEVALEDFVVWIEYVLADQESCPRILLQVNLYSRAWNLVFRSEFSWILSCFRYRNVKFSWDEADIFFCFSNKRFFAG